VSNNKVNSFTQSGLKEFGFGDRGVKTAFALELTLQSQNLFVLLHSQFFQNIFKLFLKSDFLIESVLELFIFTGLNTFLEISEFR
jgi:hypothetical protein